MNLVERIHSHAASAPERIALCGDNQALNYQALAGEVSELSAYLRNSGYRVMGLAIDNSPAWVVADLAALDAGICLVPLPPFFAPQQVNHAIEQTGMEAILVEDPEFLRLQSDRLRTTSEIEVAGRDLQLAELHAEGATLPDDVVKVTYTSGTTGAPKGVMLTWAQMQAVAESLASAVNASPQDTHLVLTPLAVLLENLAGVYVSLWAGALVSVPGLASVGLTGSSTLEVEKLAESFAAYRPSTLIITPHHLRALTRLETRSGAMFESIRFVALGGAPVERGLLDSAAAMKLPVYEGYGLSECASVVTLNVPGAHRRGSVGKPLPHLNISISGEDEVLIENHGFSGYLGQPAEEKQGILHTGDLGYIDGDGYLYLTGRKRDVFITATGRNVSPEWVESILTQAPCIQQAAVFGEARTENTAVIVPASGGDRGSIQAALDSANAALPDYARITHLVLADEPFSTANQLLTESGQPARSSVYRAYEHRINNVITVEPSKMTDFFTELNSATAVEREELLSIPFIQHGARGMLDIRSYIAFLTQAYHHVKHTTPLLMACGSRIPSSMEWLRDAFAHYIEEELGHQEWILQDIAACGGDPDQVRHGSPALETELMCAYAYHQIDRGNPVGFLGMVLVLEGTSVSLATEAAQAIQQSLDLPDTAFSYLKSHGSLDLSHMDHYRDLVNRLDEEADRQAVIRCAKNFYRLYGDIFRGLPLHYLSSREVA